MTGLDVWLFDARVEQALCCPQCSRMSVLICGCDLQIFESPWTRIIKEICFLYVGMFFSTQKGLFPNVYFSISDKCPLSGFDGQGLYLRVDGRGRYGQRRML